MAAAMHSLLAVWRKIQQMPETLLTV